MAAREAHERALRDDAIRAMDVMQREGMLAALRAHAEHGDDHAGSCAMCHVPVAVAFERPRRRGPIEEAERELARARSLQEKAQAKLTRARSQLDAALARHRAAQREGWSGWADARDRLVRARELERQRERRDELGARLASVQRELADARAERERMLKEHGKRVGHVSDVYDFVVRRLAGQDVSGHFALSATALEAAIRLPDGRSGTSPAFRVLETIALDLTALVLACEDRADLPGLLIHDSPREADLARSHYDALYRLASWLEDATSAPGFQYIVTTTTSPPKSVAFRAVRLGAATNDELLLRAALRR
jgi:hypothetical protein